MCWEPLLAASEQLDTVFSVCKSRCLGALGFAGQLRSRGHAVGRVVCARRGDSTIGLDVHAVAFDMRQVGSLLFHRYS
jgi:hypothetical protein